MSTIAESIKSLGDKATHLFDKKKDSEENSDEIAEDQNEKNEDAKEGSGLITFVMDKVEGEIESVKVDVQSFADGIVDNTKKAAHFINDKAESIMSLGYKATHLFDKSKDPEENDGEIAEDQNEKNEDAKEGSGLITFVKDKVGGGIETVKEGAQNITQHIKDRADAVYDEAKEAEKIEKENAEKADSAEEKTGHD